MLGVAAATALPSEVFPFRKIFLPPILNPFIPAAYANNVSRVDMLDMSHWGRKGVTIAELEAVELEVFAKRIPDLIFRNTPIYDFFKRRAIAEEVLTNGIAISGSPMRIPMQPLQYVDAEYKPSNLLHAPATPDNVMEFIDELERSLP